MGIDVEGVALQQAPARSLPGGSIRRPCRAPGSASRDWLRSRSAWRRGSSGRTRTVPSPSRVVIRRLHPGEEPRQPVDVAERREVARHPDVPLLRRGDHGEAGRPLPRQGVEDGLQRDRRFAASSDLVSVASGSSSKITSDEPAAWGSRSSRPHRPWPLLAELDEHAVEEAQGHLGSAPEEGPELRRTEQQVEVPEQVRFESHHAGQDDRPGRRPVAGWSIPGRRRGCRRPGGRRTRRPGRTCRRSRSSIPSGANRRRR